jgi:DNA-binding SARP family transcriptional activator
MIKDNLVDQEAIKTKISLNMAKGDIDTALEELNEYLEMNPVDNEAWSELADIYLRHQE